MSGCSSFVELGVDAVLGAYEREVECPNPDCEDPATFDAQELIARSGRPEDPNGPDPVVTPCCGLSRDELFAAVDRAGADGDEEEEANREPMADAYQFEVNS